MPNQRSKLKKAINMPKGEAQLEHPFEYDRDSPDNIKKWHRISVVITNLFAPAFDFFFLGDIY